MLTGIPSNLLDNRRRWRRNIGTGFPIFWCLCQPGYELVRSVLNPAHFEPAFNQIRHLGSSTARFRPKTSTADREPVVR